MYTKTHNSHTHTQAHTGTLTMIHWHLTPLHVWLTSLRLGGEVESSPKSCGDSELDLECINLGLTEEWAQPLPFLSCWCPINLSWPKHHNLKAILEAICWRWQRLYQSDSLNYCLEVLVFLLSHWELASYLTNARTLFLSVSTWTQNVASTCDRDLHLWPILSRVLNLLCQLLRGTLREDA